MGGRELRVKMLLSDVPCVPKLRRKQGEHKGFGNMKIGLTLKNFPIIV